MKYAEYYEKIVSRASTAAEQQDPHQLPPNKYLEHTEHGMKFTPNVIGDRVQGEKVSRIKAVRPGQGNAYYIRQILLNRPIRTWADMKRSLDGTVHASYREAAERDGLVSSDDEPIQVMQEAVHMHSAPVDLRFLLALMTHEGAAAPALWDTFKQALSRDFLPYNYDFDSSPALPLQQAFQSALNALDSVFVSFGLSNIAVGLPAAEMKSVGADAEQAYFAPKRRALRAAAAAAYDCFTTHQKHMYDTVLTAISDRSPDRLHLIQGRAGRGKTFVIKGIIDNLRGHGKLLAVCGATGLSASAFDRGTTIHKRFTIPVQEDEDEHEIALRSNMRTNSPAAAFLRSVEAIIIDEIWSLPRPVIEAVDALMRALLDSDQPFGGKPVVGVGDPRQTAPVTRENTKQATLENSFLCSPLFPAFTMHELERSQRQSGDEAFSAWIDSVGDDTDNSTTDLSAFFLSVHTANDAIQFLFPQHILEDAQQAIHRCLLSPINATVDSFNEIALRRLPNPLGLYHPRAAVYIISVPCAVQLT